MSTPDVPRSTFAEQLRTAAVQLKGLAALQAELHEVMAKCQDAIMFGTHPELIDLDGELDNCYPDAD